GMSCARKASHPRAVGEWRSVREGGAVAQLRVQATDLQPVLGHAAVAVAVVEEARLALLEREEPAALRARRAAAVTLGCHDVLADHEQCGVGGLAEAGEDHDRTVLPGERLHQLDAVELLR